MAAARPNGFYINLVRNPNSGSAAWFFFFILRWIFTLIFEIEIHEENSLAPKNFIFEGRFSWCTGSWRILALGEGHLGEVPLGGSVSLGMYQLEELPLWGSACWKKCQLGDFNLVLTSLHNFYSNSFLFNECNNFNTRTSSCEKSNRSFF